MTLMGIALMSGSYSVENFGTIYSMLLFLNERCFGIRIVIF